MVEKMAHMKAVLMVYMKAVLMVQSLGKLPVVVSEYSEVVAKVEM